MSVSTLQECLDLAAADGRRPLTEAERVATLKLWGEVFSRTKTEDVRSAVLTWLQEHPRGRPNIGELKEIISRSETHTPSVCAPGYGTPRHELEWAVRIYETRWKWVGHYGATMETAEAVLLRAGYSSWQEAKAFLVPGWSATTVTEVRI